jgi:hypothetical protein
MVYTETPVGQGKEIKTSWGQETWDILQRIKVSLV